MAGAEFGFHERHCLFIELDRLAVSAEVLVDVGQGVQKFERVRVVGAESGFRRLATSGVLGTG